MFGNRFNVLCVEIISSHGGAIKWSDSCRYLDIHFVSGRAFRCKLDDTKSRFLILVDISLIEWVHFVFHSL